MTVHFSTFGCKVNQYETQALREAFISSGFSESDEKYHADVFVVNTCCVTSTGAGKCRRHVKRLRGLNPEAIIAVHGCMAQIEGEKVFIDAGTDIVFGTNDRMDIVEAVKKLYREPAISGSHRSFTSHIGNAPDGGDFESMSISSCGERCRASVKVEDGCDNFCSYCIIPYARGAVRSKDYGEASAEFRVLAENGYSEIVLCGINLARYSSNGHDLYDLAAAACKPENIKRVRLGSLEPDRISTKMLEKLSSLEKFCPHFHISLQSGCDKTLKAMNRRYDSVYYRKLLADIRRIFPNAMITTDIITGFPGESGEDFELSKKFAAECRFSHIHVFPYSRRPNTAADKMAGHLPKAVKTQRALEMIAVSETSELDIYREYLQKSVNILVESGGSGEFFGYTENYLPCRVFTEAAPVIGRITTAIVEKCDSSGLICRSI